MTRHQVGILLVAALAGVLGAVVLSGPSLQGDAVEAAAPPVDRWSRSLERPGRKEALDADDVERCLIVAEDIDAELGARLRTLREQDPTEFKRRLLMSRRLRHLARLLEEAPHLYELKLLEVRTDATVDRLAREIKSALDEGRTGDLERYEQQLLFSLRLQAAFAIKARQDYLDRLKDHVAQLEAELEADVASLDEQVEARLRAIMAGRPVEGARRRAEPADLPAADPDAGG